MNKQLTYTELLNDPRWQKKRLEVFERDSWTCKYGHKDKPLHIHHKRYLPDYSPWEYKLEDLETLCEDCHRREHGIIDLTKYKLALSPGGQVVWYNLSKLKALGFSVMGYQNKGEIYYKYRNYFTLAHQATGQKFQVFATKRLRSQIYLLTPDYTTKGVKYYKVPHDAISFYEVVDIENGELSMIAGNSHNVMASQEFSDYD